MKKFIILCTQRTGSTLLWKYLDLHPKISAKGEIYLSSMKKPYTYASFLREKITHRIGSKIHPFKTISSYMDRYFAECSQHSACGFKLMYNQLIRGLPKWIIKEKIYIIHLIRKNYLKTLISRETAKKSGLYHSSDPQKINAVKVRLDHNTIIDQLSVIENDIQYQKKKFSSNPYIEIFYEDLITEKSFTTKRICQFLEVDFIDSLAFPLVKVNPDRPEDLIENYEEINDTLAPTKYKSFLI
jgi:LPS sulfotransferase NodH